MSIVSYVWKITFLLLLVFAINKRPTIIDKSIIQLDVHAAVLKPTTCRYPSTVLGRICTVSKCEPSESSNSSCKITAGSRAEQLTGLSCRCEPGFTISSNGLTDVIYCIEGQWFPKIPECDSVICKPLQTTTIDIVSCTYNNMATRCNKPAKVGTIINIACKKNYIQHPTMFAKSVKCLANGNWDKKPTCTPACGVSAGDAAQVKDSVPWEVAIYKTYISDGEEKRWFVCGGTIVSPLFIVSAVRCFYDENSKKLHPALDFEIAVGKFTSNYSITDGPHTRIMKAKQLHIPEGGGMKSQSSCVSDLAIVELEQSITISNHIMPVCIDWSPSANNTPPRTGKVANWGSTISDYLQVADLPLLPLNECRAMFEHEWFRFAAPQPNKLCDKFCTSNRPEVGVRYGGGWVYKQDNYSYLYGAASFETKSFIAFTRISLYLDWIEQIIRNKAPLQKEGMAKNETIETKFPVVAGRTNLFQMQINVSNPTTKNSTSCKLPENLPGRICSMTDCDKGGEEGLCNISAGRYGSVSCMCEDGYELTSEWQEVFCIKGQWIPKIPECIRVCKPLKLATLDLDSCKYNTHSVPCTNATKAGTTIIVQCKPNYIPVHPSLIVKSVTCLPDGMWDSVPHKCKPDCGLGLARVRPLSVGSQPAIPDSVPWQAAIYKRIDPNNDRYEFICGGTILSPTLIVSAAHCFYNKDPGDHFKASEFKVGVGKYTISYAHLDGPHTKIVQVKRVYVPDTYIGDELTFTSDIAILELEVIINISSKVMPICIDWSLRDSTPPSTGKVAGWGLTETGNVSEVLRIADLPYLSLNNCRHAVQNDWFRRTINQLDKFCAGTKSGAGVREGDSGGGWTYRVDGRYYIYGVVSFKEHDGDNATSIAAFTRIASYLDWIDGIKKQIESLNL